MIFNGPLAADVRAQFVGNIACGSIRLGQCTKSVSEYWYIYYGAKDNHFLYGPYETDAAGFVGMKDGRYVLRGFNFSPDEDISVTGIAH